MGDQNTALEFWTTTASMRECASRSRREPGWPSFDLTCQGVCILLCLFVSSLTAK